MKDHSSTRMTTAVLYGRYSPGRRQRENDISIEQQFHEARNYCRRNNIKIVGTYEDRAKTGTKDNRKGFQQMIGDSADGRFSAVVIWKMDRFARNREDSAIYKGILRRNGVRVISITEHIPETPEGILIEGNLETYAEFFSRKLSQDIRRGQEYKAAEGEVLGPLPLGYRRGADKKPEIVPEEAIIVKRVFKDYAAGKTIKTIVADLNALCYKTKSQNAFTRSSLGRILQNERYLGIYVYGDKRIPGGMPQMVDQDTFNACAKRMEKAKPHPAASRQMDYPLTGKLRCGICDRPMTGESGRGRNGTTYHYYKCIDQKRGAECDCRPVPKAACEYEIARVIRCAINEDTVADLSDLAIEIRDSRDGGQMKEEAARLKRDLAKVQRKIKNIMDAIEEGLDTRSTKAKLLELEGLEDDMLDAIEELSIERATITREQVLYFFEQFTEGSIDDPEFRKNLFEQFVSKVELDGGTVRITINYAPEQPVNGYVSQITQDKAEPPIIRRFGFETFGGE
ncbi:MAG: recombinase family protein [Clostridiales bacterium]|nr:recombinase family protein [Clostridiales bacterium]